MAECRGCGTPQDEDNQFCPQCGTPQTEQATEHLEQYVEKQVQRRMQAADGGRPQQQGQTQGNAGSGASVVGPLDETAIERLSYVAGTLLVVFGLSQLWLAGIALALAGIAVLPPTRELLGRPLGAPIARVPMLGFAAMLLVLGSVLSFVL